MRLTRIPSVIFIAVALSVTGTGAFAQHPATVGELIDKGGKKLSSEEITRLISDSDVSGVSASNPKATLEATFKKNGALDGRFLGARADGGAVRFWGKWSVNERSELCVDMQIGGGPAQACTPYFELGGKYYQSMKDDRSTPVYHREIKR